MKLPASVAFAPQIAAAAQRYGLDPALLAAVAAQESGGPGTNSGRNIVGDGGHGHGLFQIDDRWHAFARTAAAMNPARNAAYAAGMLSRLLTTYGGNVHQALSAYNSGSPTAIGTTTDWGDGKRVGYADSVLMHEAQLAGNGSSAGVAVAARDAAMPALADASANTNGLKSIASLLSTSTDSASESVPCPTVPQTPAPDQAKQAQAQAALTEDLGLDDDSADDASQPVRSA